MFGGGLQEVWPFAAVALHCFDGFEQRFTLAVKTSEKGLAKLERSSHFEIQRSTSGTNILCLRTLGVNAPILQRSLAQAGVAATVQGDRLRFQVHETWNRAPAEAIVARLLKALAYV